MAFTIDRVKLERLANDRIRCRSDMLDAVNSYWRTGRGQSLVWTVQFIAGSIVAPIAIVRIMFALIMPSDPFPWNFIVPLLFGAANLRWNRRPMPWLFVAGYAVAMLGVLFYATLMIACVSYRSCL
jgi:hypothetical protein